MTKASKTYESRRAFVALLIVVLAIGIFAGGSPQGAQEDEVRDITKDWKKQRPGEPAQDKSAKILYDIKTRIPKEKDRPDSVGSSEVGVTIWRFRRARADDDIEIRDLLPDGDGESEWIAERAEGEPSLSDGQRVRISIQTLRTGFLYVIDRAKYADGTSGDPYLLFPTLSIRGGNNSVMAGRVIDIPASKDKFPYLKMKRSQSKQGAEQEFEEITILVTPQKLPDLQIEEKRLKLSAQQLEDWRKQWGGPVEQAELRGGTGATITKAERDAARDPGGLLKSDDPYPQTIYRLAAKPGDPMLVTVRLRVNGKN
jgi:hypothetical protein